MPNTRIVADNAAERCTIATSTTAGVLAAANLLSYDKTLVARATGTSWTITGTTTVTEFAACFALLFSNLSPTATIRVRLYSDTAGTTLVLDTNTLQPGALACPAQARVPRGWTAAQAASAYANGGGAHARIWFALTGFKKYVVDIVDTANVQGYCEAAIAVIAPYFQFTYNPTAEAMQPVDSTVLNSTDAGGEFADAGFIRRKVSIDLSAMPAADRTTFTNILMNSRAYPILLSVFPGHTDLELERDNMVFGRRQEDSDIAVQYSVNYGSKVSVLEI